MADDFARLVSLRARIDEIDRELLALLNERTRIVEEVARVKRALTRPVYSLGRETQLFANLTAHNPGPAPATAVRRVFEGIIAEMHTVEHRWLNESGVVKYGK